MKNIGIIHYQVGGTDGVSLEIDKWKRALEEIGHKVHLCAGDLGNVEGTLIEELFHHRPDIKRLSHNTFIELVDYKDETAYKAELNQLVAVLERKLKNFILDNDINYLITQNVWANTCSPPVSIAIARVMHEYQIPTIAHHHDFYWERFDGVALTCATAIDLADKYMPPRDPLIRHVVINSLAKKELAERKGINATVVPNVFDFNTPHWSVDEYNQDFKQQVGLRQKDIVILQATRIVAKKGIELAVDFVHALNKAERRALLSGRGLYDGRPFDNDSRIVLVLAGYTQDDITGTYVENLKEKITRRGIDALFIENHVGGRRANRNEHKIYSLWDTYVFADFVTYPSLWEGWGNQFLEALRARLPILLFEYPVYRVDIKDKGFDVISLGHELHGVDDLGLVQIEPHRIEAAADQAVALLTDSQLRHHTVDHNYNTGLKHYSLEALKIHLGQLLED